MHGLVRARRPFYHFELGMPNMHGQAGIAMDMLAQRFMKDGWWLLPSMSDSSTTPRSEKGNRQEGLKWAYFGTERALKYVNERRFYPAIPTHLASYSKLGMAIYFGAGGD